MKTHLLDLTNNLAGNYKFYAAAGHIYPRETSVVVATTGNWGLSLLAHGLRVTAFVPTGCLPRSVLYQAGATRVIITPSFHEAERQAQQEASISGHPYVSYDAFWGIHALKTYLEGKRYTFKANAPVYVPAAAGTLVEAVQRAYPSARVVPVVPKATPYLTGGDLCTATLCYELMGPFEPSSYAKEIREKRTAISVSDWDAVQAACFLSSHLGKPISPSGAIGYAGMQKNSPGYVFVTGKLHAT